MTCGINSERCAVDIFEKIVAGVLVIRAFISTSKTAPATYVIDKDRCKWSIATLHVGQQLSQRLATFDPQTTFTLICIGADDLVSVDGSVFRTKRLLAPAYETPYAAAQ
jgi:hypothetical protein